MFISSLRTLLLLLATCGLAIAAPPNTLGYQGRLANSSGQPISATLNITFRLYDVASGGSALWTETQASVPVDGGNLAVELGRVTPLPTTIWGQQLYLGVQISGDSEMLPRPPLTAAPYALRAAGTMKNTLVVSGEGTPTENGNALIAAVAGISGASAANPVTIEVDAGTFDLGSAELAVPAYVGIVGRSQMATTLVSANPVGTVRLASNTTARQFTARNTGVPPDANSNAYAIGADTPAHDNTPVDNVTLQDVTGVSTAATGTPGGRWGIWMCVTGSRALNVTGIAQGGQFTVGFRADCPTSRGLVIDGVFAVGSDSSDGVRGVYIAGGGPWNNIKAIVTSTPTAASVYGVRVFANTVDVGALLSNVLVSIDGGSGPSTTAGALVDGIRIESADVDIKGALVSLEKIQVTNAAGIRINATPSGPNPIHVVTVSDASIHVTGIQRASLGSGAIYGVRVIDAAPIFSHSTVTVRCLAGGYNACVGVRRQSSPAGLQPSALVLDQVSMTVGHDAPADSSAQSTGYSGEGQARIVNSSIRVLRSPSGELQQGVTLQTADADVRVLNSTVEIESTVTPTSDCVIAGSVGSAEFFSNHFRGGSCASGATLTCAGNTKRGSGFLSATCP